MGASSSSSSSSGLLDESQSSSITERAEAELRDFVPYYRKQMSAARFSELENQLEPERRHTHRLRHKESPQAQVLYEEPGLVLDHNRKWRERYLVVRGDRRLESHEGLEGFMKGFPPVQVLVPSGGSLWTSLDSYVDQVQRSFPGLVGVKEEFCGFSGFSGSRFLVFLNLPHRRDVAFCFKNQDQRDRFCRVLEDCIRHQNHDFLKRRSLEVEAFVRAVRFYQQERGWYRSESLLIGSDMRVLSNLVKERLLPEVQQDLLDRLRAPRGQRTQTWLTVLEEVHVLLDSVLLARFSRVQQEVRDWIRTLEPSMTSDLDLIRESQHAIRRKVRASVSAAAERLTTEKVAPHLSAMLAALMEPVSNAFLQGRGVSHSAMEVACQSADAGGDAKPRKLIASMPRANLQSCYQTLGSITNKLAPHAKVFQFPNALTLMLIDRTRLDLQQLVENAEFTFQQILLASDSVDPDSAYKAKQRVLQHFDYDSSIMRKKIVQEALISITLPYVKEQMDCDYRTELAELQQSLDSDSAPFVAVDNEYEDVIVETLIRQVAKALTDPANLEKFHLIPDPVQEKSPEPEPGTKLESVPDQESVPETGSGPEPQPGQEQESVAETGSGPEPQPGQEQESVAETGSGPEPQPGPEQESVAETGSGPEPEAGPEPQPGPEQESVPETGSGPDPEAGPETGSGPEPEAGPIQESVPEPEAGPEPQPGLEQESVAESRSGPEQESVAETGSGPEPEAGPEQESVPETGSGAEPEPGPEQGLEPEPAPVSEPVSEPGPEQEPRVEAEPEPYVEPELKPEHGPELDPGKEKEPCVEPEPVPGPRPEDGPQSETGPDPEPDPSSANASLPPDCVRAISELVVLNRFPDVVRLED